MSASAHITLPQQKKTQSTRLRRSESSHFGIIIAVTIIGLWAVSLAFLLSLDISQTHILLLLPAILWQTFLYTGLFITAHDAMHGVVFPQNHKINNFIGSLAVSLYALFPYDKLLKKHWSHHHNPASDLDPDFHDGEHKNPLAWYFNFMKGYWSWTRIVGIMLIYNIGIQVLHIPGINLNLFWAFPPILSSLQLFYFGTYLPHREPKEGYNHPHRAQTTQLPVFWSFITCYHFGYHEEHHEYPHAPWWNLPSIYKMHAKL